LSNDIKTMQLYHRPERILAELQAQGLSAGAPLTVEELNRFDQLHYHGTDALDAAITECGIGGGDRVLEVGSGWGGCARYIANKALAQVTAVELQADYDQVARDLTARVALKGTVDHVNADFLDLDLKENAFDHAVSWLALFHIPRRETYLGKLNHTLKTGGFLFVEDLYLIQQPGPDEADDFQQHLRPGSLIDREAYIAALKHAGFDVVHLADMTADWADFTVTRLQAFRDARKSYEAVHGPDGYAAIELFYAKMAGYFARGLVGGVRFAAVRRA
jgi:sarcosine/dimethylglycine N-methyltransferase